MGLESLEALAGLQVPNLNHLVVGGGEDPPVVSLQTADHAGVALVGDPVQRVDARPGADTPHLRYNSHSPEQQ